MTDVYEFAAPSYQNAIDLLPGWNHSFPPEHRLNAGPAYMYEDQRIRWAVEQFGSVEGKHILKLGPFEGSHTYMLERYGPRREFDAVEANKLAYLRCLVAKEVFGLRRAQFHLGDFVHGVAKSDALRSHRRLRCPLPHGRIRCCCLSAWRRGRIASISGPIISTTSTCR